LAMRSGRIAIAMSICRQISHLLLSCDCTPSLESAATEMQEYVYQMMKLKEGMAGSCLPFLQYFLILMGDGGDDPSALNGRVMNYESSLKGALSKSDMVTILDINTVRIRLLYLFGRYNEAGRLVKDVLSLHDKLASDAYHSDILGHTLYCGLTAAVLGCSNPHEAREWHRIANATLKEYELYAAHSEWNFAHRVALLKAEVAHFINYDIEAALKHYKVAIDLAEKHKFPGERALALERAAMFCEGTCQTDLAQGYYKEAERAYREWGAIRKADHVAVNVMEAF
jgi:tetratricopeptide (TPR) repeat protein